MLSSCFSPPSSSSSSLTIMSFWTKVGKNEDGVMALALRCAPGMHLSCVRESKNCILPLVAFDVE